MLRKWKTAAIVFLILSVALVVAMITNHYYGWINTIIEAFQPVVETSSEALAAIFKPFRFEIPKVLWF